MRYLKLNTDGTIECILNERIGEECIEIVVPDEYPETFEWDVEEQIFKASFLKGMNLLREKRNQLLAESDWAEYSRKLSSQNKTKWLEYRDALFDLPENITDPFNFEWPVKPE